MAPINLNQLTILIERQDKQIAYLRDEIDKLKNWSDLNDHYLQEMIESLNDSMDRLRTAINELHEHDKVEERIRELEAEDALPTAQLLRNFIEKNATAEEQEEMQYKPKKRDD